MGRIERYYYNLDHSEALAINRQLASAPQGTTSQNVIDLNRFCDCCDDDEGYDVPKERMRSLKAVGLVDGGRGGWYSLTDAGQSVRDSLYDGSRTAQAQASAPAAVAT